MDYIIFVMAIIISSIMLVAGGIGVWKKQTWGTILSILGGLLFIGFIVSTVFVDWT